MVKWLLELAQWRDLVLPLLYTRQLERSDPTWPSPPVEPSATFTLRDSDSLTRTGWRSGAFGVELPSGPVLLSSEALSHKFCTPSKPVCSTPYPPKSVPTLCLGTGGSVLFYPWLASSCPKGRTVHLVALDVSLTLTEVREQGFGSYRACVKGTWVSSSGRPLCCYGTCFGLCSNHDSRVRFLSFYMGSCSHRHSALL